MEIKTKLEDFYWSYIAHFFSIISGILVLPFILSNLSASEIGLNYIMLTITSFVTFLDFGFAPQLGRNITYIYSGSQNLKKNGIDTKIGQINFKLLKTAICAAKFIYKKLALLVFIGLITVGYVYLYFITNNFTSFPNIIFIWLLFSCSVAVNISISYYSSLLNGKGLISEARKAMFFSKFGYTILVFILLYFNLKLFSIVIANFFSVLIYWFYSHKFYFTTELNEKLEKISILKSDITEVIDIIKHNAIKLGLVYLGSFIVSKFGLFISSLFLPLSVVGSYGLLMQLVGLISTISLTIFTVYQTRLSSLLALNKITELKNEFSFTLTIFSLLFVIGSACFLFSFNYILLLFNSKVSLPSLLIIICYLIVVFFESNFTIFTTFITFNNEIPYVKATLISGFLSLILLFCFLKFTTVGLLGIVVIPGCVQLFYNYWKWPLVVLARLKSNYFALLRLGFNELISKLFCENV